eukprot:SAG31_NODE_130_length_23424_cov_45.648802_1_plen_131_part_00
MRGRVEGVVWECVGWGVRWGGGGAGGGGSSAENRPQGAFDRAMDSVPHRLSNHVPGGDGGATAHPTITTGAMARLRPAWLMRYVGSFKKNYGYLCLLLANIYCTRTKSSIRIVAGPRRRRPPLRNFTYCD